MDVLKKSLASEPAAKGKKPRKASAGQKEMLVPIEGKKPAAKKAEAGALSVKKGLVEQKYFSAVPNRCQTDNSLS